MAPATKFRQPLAHDWRRHSLVRVRRPVWAGHAPEVPPARDEQAPLAQASAQKAHTTQDDISWD